MNDGKLRTKRVVNLKHPRFTWNEIKELADKRPITWLGVKITHLAGNWFRFEAKNLDVCNDVIKVMGR
jgi:hypothetical protein